MVIIRTQRLVKVKVNQNRCFSQHAKKGIKQASSQREFYVHLLLWIHELVPWLRTFKHKAMVF